MEGSGNHVESVLWSRDDELEVEEEAASVENREEAVNWMCFEEKDENW